jgi:FkbM family methyltransferase
MTNIKINNKSFLVSDTNIGWWTVVSHGNWEPYTFNIIDKFITEESICIDLGAWYGFISLYMAQTSRKVYCVEPDKIAFDDLKISCENTEKSSNICVYNCAISNYNGIIELGNDNKLGDSTTGFKFKNNSFSVNCYTLSTFCENNNIANVDFLKIDIEASEEFLFEDINFFDKYKPTIFLQLHQGNFVNRKTAADNFKKLSNLYLYIYDENLNRLKEVDPDMQMCILSNKLV